MGRCNLRLIKWFLDFWKTFLGFSDILEGIRNNIQELGIHRTELGRACIHQTQNLRKWIYVTWNMNKSLCERFLGEMRPWNTSNSHKQPSPKIWFETKHFEILSFLGPGLSIPPITSWAWNGSRYKISWILEIFHV